MNSLRQFLLISVCLLSFMTSKSHADEFIKSPNVSGRFYSSNKNELSSEVSRHLSDAQVNPFSKFIDVIIAPHAGYFYSGSVAGYSFKSVSQYPYKTIVILAPSHFYGFDGISVWPKGAFDTPLGQAVVDEDFSALLLDQPNKIYFEPKAFQKEHSLEVEIPFLQKIFNDIKIVPVILGQASVETLEKFSLKLVNTIGDRKDVLIVVSTDLSHYYPDSIAREMDRKTIEAIQKLSIADLLQGQKDQTMEACGIVPVTAAIFFAKHKGLNQVDLLNYANSGDVSGEKTSVVGFSALAIYSK